MSIFKKNGLGRKALRRKIERNKPENSMREEEDPIIVRLGDEEKIFSNGRWISRWSEQNEAVDESEVLRKSIIELDEENNLLKLKYEVLMDMLLEQSMHYNGNKRIERNMEINDTVP